MITLKINNKEFILKLKFFYNNYMNLQNESRKKLKSNGNTVCSFTLTNAENDMLVLSGTGYSRCSRSDVFSKKVGRYYAFARAIVDAFVFENTFLEKFVIAVCEKLPNITIDLVDFVTLVNDNLKKKKD